MRKVLFALPLLSLACDPGREPPPGDQPPPLQNIEKTSALTAANQNLRTVLVGAAEAGAFTEDHALLSDLLGAGDAVGCAPGEQCPDASPDMATQATDMADDVAQRILNVANVEVEEATRIVLRVKAEQACDGSESCIQQLTQVPVRIELTSRREGDIDVALTIGEHNVGKLELYRASIAAEVDFGAAMDAAKAMAQAAGEPLDEINGTIRGRVRVELIKNGENDFTGQVSILSPIDVDATVGEDVVMLDIGTSKPLASVRIDGNTPQIITESNVGGVEMSLPLAAFQGSSVDCAPAAPGEEPPRCTEPEPLEGTLSVSVGSTHTKLVIDDSNEVRVEYSQSEGAQVRYNGLPILSYDINPNNGGQLDARMAIEDEGFMLAVSPLLDLQAAFNLNNLPASMVEETPEIFREDTLQLLLHGAPEPAIRTRTQTEVMGDVVTERTVLEVVSGRLTMSSNAAGTQVVVNAGMCLDSVEPDPNQENVHPFELLTEAACQ